MYVEQASVCESASCIFEGCFPLVVVMGMSGLWSDVNVNGGKWCSNPPALRAVPKYLVYFSCITLGLAKINL